MAEGEVASEPGGGEEDEIVRSKLQPLASDSQTSLGNRSDIVDSLPNGIGKPDVHLESRAALPDEGGMGVKLLGAEVAVEKRFSRQNSERGGAAEGGKVKGPGGEKNEESEIQETLVMPLAVSPNGRFNKFDIEIGRGSFKTVYKGLDTETGVAVAWCELQENRYNKAEQARFKEEVAILKALQHPNILRLYDTWETKAGGGAEKRESKVLVLITELMTSGTLKTYMRRFRPKPKVIRSWGRQILRGLLFLHTRTPPIIHRDLKCDNIFINGTTGLVRIGDLGLATLKRSDVKTVIGTPEFMAPEMYEENYDESVDVYAFGMCLLEMATLEYPYMECKNPAQIYKRVTSGTPPLSLEKVKDVDLRNMIVHCTCVDKGQRFMVKDLIQHVFFAEDGMNVDVTQSEESPDKLVIRMMVHGDTKKKNGEEAIEFPYDLKTDNVQEVVGEMVKTGMLRSEHQKMALRTIKETIETELHKRNRDKDKERMERLQTQQSAAVPTEPVLVEGSESVTGSMSKTARQPSNSDLTTASGQQMVESKERSHTPALPPTALPEARKQSESHSTTPAAAAAVVGNKPNTDTLASSPTTAPPISTPSYSSVVLASATPTGSALVSSAPPITPVPPSEHPGVAHPVEVPQNPAPAPQTEVPTTTNLGAEKTEDPHREQAPVKQSSPAETTGNGLESSSTPALFTNTVTAAPATTTAVPAAEDIILPVSSSQEQEQPSIAEFISSQPTGEKAGPTVIMGVAGGGATNGGKKKAGRGKGRMTLSLVEVTPDDVVKCVLVTKNEVRINFQFSRKFDETKAIFKKLMRAGHLREAEEENFVQQAEKIVLMTKNKTIGTTGDQQETKPSKMDPPQPTSETNSAKTSPLTPRVATKGSHPPKSSSPGTGEAPLKTDVVGVSVGVVNTERPQAKVVSEVTGEIVPFVADESSMSMKTDQERERERPGRVPAEGGPQRPLTRDVATGMSPAMGSTVVLGSQSSGEERKTESPPSLSTQTSNESVSGSVQPSPPVQGSSPPGLAPSQSGPIKTSSLPVGNTTTPAAVGSSPSGFEVCSVSEPLCPTAADSQQTTFTPSTQRRFVVADVAEENDSPDELSGQGSTDSLPQGEVVATVEPVDPATAAQRSASEISGGVEVIVVTSVAPEITGQRESVREEVTVPRPHLMSATSYSSAVVVDPNSALRQRSTSLPYKLCSSSGQTPTGPAPERVGVACPTTMPVIPESSLTSESSDVFTSDVPISSSATAQTSQSRQQTHTTVKPHPLPVSDHSPSPQPQAPPTVPFADMDHQQSEMLSNAFMYFIFSMNRMLKDPSIMPLIHHLEDRYGGAHLSSEFAPPTDRTERRDEDLDLRRKVADLEHQLQSTKRQLVERQREREQLQYDSNTAPSLSHPHTTGTATSRQSLSARREQSASPAPPRKIAEERGREETAGATQGMAQREKMEQRVRDAIFSVPLHSSPPPPHMVATATAAPVVSFHSSYHGETTDQLRNRSRPTWDGTRRYSGPCNTTSTRSVYPQTYVPPSIHSPVPPHFISSPSTPHIPPQLPTVTTSPPSLHHQPSSQEWTEYTSASAESISRGSTPFPPAAPANNGLSPSQKGPDVSEFDPIHS